ncbi:tetratricopeptide repeat-containing sensor histidine kinase [Maribacter sp. 2-571]|uniref:tetratricopeptide repeat-containing sensor histidine kinase n=1 Tax=Maribacter sp. 2-571 TaxID=3417569 RepID=UPI003D336A55
MFPNLRLYLFSIVLAFAMPSHAQESSSAAVDSLEQLLHAADNDFQKAHTLIEIAKSASGIDSVKAYDSAHRALAFFQKNEDSLGLGKAYSALGFVVYDYNEMQKAERYYKKAKRLFEREIQRDSSEKLIDLWADAVLNLASSISNQGRKDEELVYLTELAPIVKKYKNYKVLGIINSNIGITFFNNNEFSKAYGYFNENDTNYEQTDAYSQFAADRLIFSSCLMEMDSLDRAKKILEKARSILLKTPQSPRWQLYYQQLGEYHSKKGQYQKALTQYDRSLQRIKQSKHLAALPQLYLQYVETYQLMGDHKKQKEYMLRFLEISQKENPHNALYALEALTKYERRDENHEAAARYADRYFKLNDSIKIDEIEKETARLEQRYQKEKRDREILALRNKNNETDLSLERKKSQNYLLYFLLGSLAFISISGYLTYNNRQKKALLKQKEQEQEIQRLKTEQERELFGVMMEGVEQERKRLAADLHDGLGGRLSGVSIKLSKLSEEKKAAAIAPQIDDILANLDDSLQELRGVARNLMPETLIKYGLKAALEDYCSTLKYKDTDIVLQFYSKEKIKNNNSLLTIYRIIQELINNAVKHANATEILVQYIHEDGKVTITVEDDGVGFDPTAIPKTKGMGLSGLKNRVDYLNGSMDISSERNEGTSVNIQINNV